MEEEVFLQDLVDLLVNQAKWKVVSDPKIPNSLKEDCARLPTVSSEAKVTAHFRKIDSPINILSEPSYAKSHKAESKCKLSNPIQTSTRSI